MASKSALEQACDTFEVEKLYFTLDSNLHNFLRSLTFPCNSLYTHNKRQTKTRTGADPKVACAVKPKMFAAKGSEIDLVLVYNL